MPRGVILGPQDVPRPARLFVPRGVNESRRPVGTCLLCKAEFYDPAEYQRHAANHVRKDIDELRAQAPSAQKPSIFHPDSQDRELEKHWRGVRERMAKEKRTEVRPNELAERGD